MQVTKDDIPVTTNNWEYKPQPYLKHRMRTKEDILEELHLNDIRRDRLMNEYLDAK